MFEELIKDIVIDVFTGMAEQHKWFAWTLVGLVVSGAVAIAIYLYVDSDRPEPTHASPSDTPAYTES